MMWRGWMIRTYRALTNINPGFAETAMLHALRITIPKAQAKADEQVLRRQEEISHTLAAIPGVSSVGISSKIPMTGGGWHDPIFIEDRTYAEGQLPPLRGFKFISPEYLGRSEERRVGKEGKTR